MGKLFGRNWLTGIICLWSGAIVDIPNGWALCDGGNGTPDLRNKFIVGAGDTYAVAATGGSTSHDHTGSISEAFVVIQGYTESEIDYLEYGFDIDDADGYGDFYYYTEGHYHEVDLYGTGHDHSPTIDSRTTLPPYYALAYIVKV